MALVDTCSEAPRLIDELSTLLKSADVCGCHEAAIHINEAIIALGGIGVMPPVD